MPYIAMVRQDIPEGILQVLDLVPNTSQRNPVMDPPGQTKYVSFRPQNEAVSTSGAFVLVGETKGLAAYLIDQIEDTPNGDALTAAEANTIAAALITDLLNTASAMTLAAVNAKIQVTVAGSGIGLGNSTGTLVDILRIMSGDEYVVPDQAILEAGGVFSATIKGAFSNSGVGRVRHTYNTGALTISLAAGHLKEFTDANYSYKSTTGRALVVYGDDGSVLG